jgi:LmbE family N-acetylglucosaminyl deacetylase
MRDAGLHVVIVCATGRNNPVRAPEFLAACHVLKATPILLDYRDGRNSPIPDLKDELSRIRNVLSAENQNVFCILTHPPHGNAHRHPQHLDCFAHVKRWAGLHNVPFGVFSERPASDLRHSGSFGSGGPVEMSPVSPIWIAPFRDLLSFLRKKADQSVRPARGATADIVPARAVSETKTAGVAASLGNMSRLARVVNRVSSLRPFWEAVAALSVQIDFAEKQALCDLYVSQLEGLKEYLAYEADREFLYLNDLQTARDLEGALR